MLRLMHISLLLNIELPTTRREQEAYLRHLGKHFSDLFVRSYSCMS